MYDHVTDVIIGIGVLIIVMKKKKRPITWHPVAVLLVALALFIVSMGCQQRKKSNHDDESLDMIKVACRDENWITWTRFLGPTTFHIVVTLVVIYLFHEKQPK
jgi:phosphatidylglycerophosphate synthase